MDGQLTAKVGKAISRELNDRGYEVYFDHGNADDVFVGTIAVSIEEVLNRDTEISQLDIAVVEESSRNIIALIEIEETTDKPKTLIGDVFAVLIGDSIQLPRGKEGKVDEWTTLIVVCKGEGHKDRNENILKMANKAKGILETGNSRIGNVVIDNFSSEYEIETILMETIEEAIRRKSYQR